MTGLMSLQCFGRGLAYIQPFVIFNLVDTHTYAPKWLEGVDCGYDGRGGGSVREREGEIT